MSKSHHVINMARTRKELQNYESHASCHEFVSCENKSAIHKMVLIIYSFAECISRKGKTYTIQKQQERRKYSP